LANASAGASLTINGSGTDNGFETMQQTVTPDAQSGPHHVTTVISPDDAQAYSISTKFGVLAVNRRDTTTGRVLDGSGDLLDVEWAGLTPGAALAMSGDGNYLYVTNPAED